MKNIKILTKSEISFCESLYDFDIDENNIYIKSKKIHRITVKDRHTSWSLLVLPLHRRITFNVTTVDMYAKLKDKYSIFKVQSAISELIVTYQPITKKSVIDMIEFRLSKEDTYEKN